MTTTQTLPSPAAFKRQALARFRSINPDAADVTIAWDFISAPLTFVDGSGTRYRSGHGMATATGYKPRRVMADVTEHGRWTIR